jgi:hypothetical protein
MTHNIKSGIALFLEAKYKTLTIEVHWGYRVIITRLDNGKHPFSYIRCENIHLSKNM